MDTIGVDNTRLLGTDINHGISYRLDNLKQVRARDYRSLLHFLRRGMTEDKIRRELKANHITTEMGLEDYVALVLHSYAQVIAWVSRKGSPAVKTIAGI